MNKKFTTTSFQNAKKENKKITMLTAYDYSMAKIVDEAGVDLYKGCSRINHILSISSRHDSTDAYYSPLYKKNLELVRYINTVSEGKLPILGVGGIMSGEEAQAMMDAGASLVEIYSGFIYEGPALVKQILTHLEQNNK